MVETDVKYDLQVYNYSTKNTTFPKVINGRQSLAISSENKSFQSDFKRIKNQKKITYVRTNNEERLVEYFTVLY